jgi:gliding motility-associated-like protein
VKQDCYIDVPNAFTPNGDGVNDYFLPRPSLAKGLTSFTMSVYNRWGQLIFETDKIEGRGWDGRFNGAAQPEGVYVFMIDAKFKDGQIEKRQGNVTLLR